MRANAVSPESQPMLATTVAAIAAALLIVGYLSDWRRLRRRPRLGAPTGPVADAPLISVLIPARNEERSIARCVAGVLALQYPRLELLVLDDGSTDGTAAALAPFAADRRLRLLQGRPLAQGWTGKCNACQQLGAAASGEWLLFLDADTAPQPGLASALLAHARGRGLDLVTLFPFMELGSFWERAVLPPFLALITALFPVERLERADTPPGEVLANGQCIFVRRAAYLAVGGHGSVRAEVLEDVRLAQVIRAAGYRVGGGEGMELLRVRMYRSGAEVAQGLMKNAAAGFRSGGARSLWAAVALVASAWGPLWLLGAGSLMLVSGAGGGGAVVLGRGALAWAAALSLWGALYRELYELSPVYALVWPIGLLAYLLIALGGIWRVRSGRGVVWKGRTYSG
jgi:chlorobactene glucosyltransferase